MINSGQCSDPGPVLDGCDREACTDAVGGEHAPTCVASMTDAELRAEFERRTRRSYNASDVEAIVAELGRRDPILSPLAQTWCDRCDLPATTSVPLTTGETAFRCSQHAWLIVAPNGGKR